MVQLTTDGGQTWQRFSFPENDSLQFRDVHGFNQDSCLVLSAGPGSLSRIYRFSVSQGFALRYQMPHPKGFLDALALQATGKGYAYADAVDGLPFILETSNFGQSWLRVEAQHVPLALKGEGGFAASGTCVSAGPPDEFIIGTGAGGHARLLVKNPDQENWQAFSTPMPTGDFAGITSVQAQDSVWSIAGGNLADSSQQKSVFLSFDKGQTWQPTQPAPVPGAYYGSALGRWGQKWVLAVCGPQGAALSLDLGMSWHHLSSEDFWTCALVPESGKLWLAGRHGKIKAFDLHSF